MYTLHDWIPIGTDRGFDDSLLSPSRIQLLAQLSAQLSETGFAERRNQRKLIRLLKQRAHVQNN